MLKFKWETEFKETEIGEIPKDWEVKKLGEVVEAIKGISYKSDEINLSGKGDIFVTLNNFLRGGGFKKNEFKFYTGNNAKDEQKVRNGDLIIALTDMTSEAKVVGAPAIVSLPDEYDYGLISLDCAKIIPKTQISNYYLFAYLSASQEENSTFANGVNVLHLNLEHFLTHKLIPYPTLSEQSRVATVLSWFDDLIENKKRQNEILEKTAMAIFKSWFIDFEPFKDEEFVYNEELGKEIPKGWEVDYTTRFIEFNPTIKLQKGKIYPFVEMKQVYPHSAMCEFDLKEFDGSGVKYYGGDTLMARITPSLEHGKTAFIWFISEKENGFGTTEFFVLHPKSSWLKYFVYLLAKNSDFREAAINSMTGTSGRQRADVEALKNYLIPIPPSPILQRFHSLVEPLFQKIILNQKQTMTLRKIRDTLLPLLVFGKLRVEEI